MGNIIVAKKGRRDSVTGLNDIHVHFFARIAVGAGKYGYKHVGAVLARSGLAGKQNFRTLANQIKGQYEPCPEGRFKLGPMLWRGAKGDYNTLWPGINSPWWIEIDPARATGFHRDAGVPGTAGCIGLLPVEEKKLINLINGYGTPTELYADWGLGLKLPASLTFPDAK